MNQDEIMKIFEKMKNFRAKNEAKWKELDAFDRNQQWEEKNIPTWIPKPITNYINLVKEYKTAAISLDNLTGKLRPLSIMDQDKIDLLQKWYISEWDRCGVKYVIRDSISRSKLLGTGITYVGWDSAYIDGGTDNLKEGKLVVKNIDVSNFYVDPVAHRLEDSRYCAISERKTLDWLKSVKIFNQEKIREVEENLKKNNNANTRGEIYTRDYNTNQEDAIQFLHFFFRTPSENGGFKYSCKYLANGIELHTIDKLLVNDFPFSICYDKSQVADFYGKSTCELVLDNQKIVNKVESIISTIALLIQNPQKIVRADSGIIATEMATYGNAPGTVFKCNGDPQTAVYWVKPPEIPATLLQLNSTAKENIRETAGLSEAYTGQSVGSLTTSQGVNSLIGRATMRDKDSAIEVNRYIERLSKLIIEHLINGSQGSPQTTIRLDNTNPNADIDYEFIDISPGDYEDIKFDFVVDVSARTPESREKEKADMLELMRMQMQFQPEVPLITPEEMIHSSEFALKDVILSRLKANDIEKQKNQVAQITELAMETMNPENEEMYGMPMDQILQMGLQILRPMPQKLGNVGEVQQKQGLPQ